MSKLKLSINCSSQISLKKKSKTINDTTDIRDKNNNGLMLFKFAIFIKTPPPLEEKFIESVKKNCPIKYINRYKIRNI